MATTLKHATLEEYYECELNSEVRYEFLQGEIIEMVGNKAAHIRITGNLTFYLHDHLDDAWEVFPGTVRVAVPESDIRFYPDVMLATDVEWERYKGTDTALNPQLVIEILSPTTEGYDRTDKLPHYQKISSLQEILLVSQSEPLVEQYVRQADGSWPSAPVVVRGLEQRVQLSAVPCELPLAAVYQRVDLNAEKQADD